jgi:hypothetical protein
MEAEMKEILKFYEDEISIFFDFFIYWSTAVN